MDGRVGSLAREFERLVMLKLYRPEYHLELLKLLKSQTWLKAKTRNGVSYNTGNARASGSPETSAFNTLLNGFISYLGFRMTRVDGRYMTSVEAWAKLGLYGGDDGLTVDQDRKAAEKAALAMGQVMTVDRTKRGDVGVAFLARHYGPDVWWGDFNSCCDIRRQLAKFHVTTKLCSKVTPTIKLQEKAFAFSLCDANTPVIGWFVQRVLEMFPMNRGGYQNHLAIWNSDVEPSNHYPNEYAEWMLDLLKNQIPDFDIDGFINWIHYTRAEDLFNCPQFAEPPPPAPKPGIVAVDDDILVTEPTTAPKQAVKPLAADDTRKRFRGRKPTVSKAQHAPGRKRPAVKDRNVK